MWGFISGYVKMNKYLDIKNNIHIQMQRISRRWYLHKLIRYHLLILL